MFLLDGTSDERDEKDDNASEEKGDGGKVEKVELAHDMFDPLWPWIRLT